ncbi:ferritin-like domain-containing protein [Clostridium cellulovorans]|uniref:Rubrerythrin n=1 Tax=Clostridium cellulovorans (strain ATCC 35296 / DSM 3052 / OCM 3 / 743B) TaxID=573061 RepID=D9SPI7_CLOC7|nr:ferritin-like domain-containing protein [Clostridium cellulovorans]ADL50036.1 Rubrerythrin [Clostridium cellulovorans 743B]
MEKNKSKQMMDSKLFKEAIEGIKDAVQGEREDELFYDYLLNEAEDDEEKDIISDIRDDERRHNRIYKIIYEDLTGREVSKGDEESFKRPKSYLDGIKRALLGELRAVEKYRDIRRKLPRGQYIDVLTDIITDELKHASKYNLLYTINMNKNMNNNMDKNNNKNGSMNNNMNGNMNENMSNLYNDLYENASRAMQDTSKFTPDEWVKYIMPVVENAMTNMKEDTNNEHLYQVLVLSGVLIGLGMKPEDAINKVQDWEKTGESELLVASKMSRYFFQ